MLKLCVLVIVIFTNCIMYCDAITLPELKLLSVIFRHGDREPNDSKSGDLTNVGRRRAYQLGRSLRERYGSFLGSAYEPADCSARSSEYARAQMSLQLVLAALYVPRAPWHDSLAWQPVPYAYAPESQDILLFPKYCPRFVRELRRAESTPAFQRLLDPYRDMLAELTRLTGEELTSSNHMFLLYHKLAAMQSMNRTLPRWAADIFPAGLLLNGTYLEYDALKYTDYMRKINGGALVRKIVDDMLGKRAAELGDRRKLFLYSSHELIIVSVLQTLKIWTPHIPEYTSSIIIELLEDRRNYFVKILYYEGIPAKFQEMQIPGCLTFCPLSRFIELIADQLPAHDEMICDEKIVSFREMTAP